MGTTKQSRGNYEIAALLLRESLAMTIESIFSAFVLAYKENLPATFI
jgi:hypothetical protein